jgi:hypothetical protein
MTTFLNSLNFYGISVKIESTSQDISNYLNFDFSQFISPEQNSFTIKLVINVGDIPEGTIPEGLMATMHSPKFVVFDSNEKRYVDYHGKTIVVYDYKNEWGEIFCKEAKTSYEIIYLLILSRIGELLDKKGLHRVHSLGFTFENNGILCLIPENGGKSTLALELMHDPNIKIMSEDTPLLNHRGQMWPFNLRFGFRNPALAKNVHEKYKREFLTEGRPAKTLVHAEAYKNSLAQEYSKVNYLFIGQRIQSQNSSLAKIGKLNTLVYLSRDCIFGLGLPQVVEFFLRNKPSEHIKKIKIVLYRLWACLCLLQSAKAYKLYMGRDTKLTKEMLLKFIRAE